MLYVDHARIPYKGMKMSHLVADTHMELLEAAERLDLEMFIQHAQEPNEHLDICERKRTDAIGFGAKSVTSRELVKIIQSKRQTRDWLR